MKPIPLLPLDQELETKRVLKAATQAHKYLGQLNGISKTIPNEGVLLNLLPLQEVQAISEIENIVTTMEELYKSKIDNNTNLPTKEVHNYAEALLNGFYAVKEKKRYTAKTLLMLYLTILTLG